MNQRPTGITILALIFMALGTLSFIWSLVVFGFGGISSLFGTLFTLSPQVSGNLWGGLLGMAAAAVQFAAGAGLLGMKSWGWYLALLGVGLSFVQGLLGMFSGGLLTLLCGCVGILIPGAILVYLLQPRIRALFGIGAPPKGM